MDEVEKCNSSNDPQFTIIQGQFYNNTTRPAKNNCIERYAVKTCPTIRKMRALR